MQLLKRSTIASLFSILILTLLSLVYTILLHNGKLDSSTGSIYKFSLIIGSISFFTLGFIMGKMSKNKTFLNSFLLSFIIIIILTIIRLLSKSSLDYTILIKYLIYILSSSFGGILGGIRLSKKGIH